MRSAAAGGGGGVAKPGATATANGALAGDADTVALRARADSNRILGSPQAKVWMLIVSDFQCPYCKMWHDQSWAAIKHDYVDAGKVRVAYLHFPLEQHEQAQATAEASMCASAQGKFWEYGESLFASQARWAKPGDQSGVYDSLAVAQGLDAARFRSCMASHVMHAVVEADQDRMRRAGVQSTPSFYVGNTPISGAQPTDVFRRVLDAALAGGGRPAR